MPNCSSLFRGCKNYRVFYFFYYLKIILSILADALLKEGIYVIGFSYPVVPKGKGLIILNTQS